MMQSFAYRHDSGPLAREVESQMVSSCSSSLFGLFG